MTDELTHMEAELHNEYYTKALTLAEKYIYIGGPLNQIGFFAKRRLKKAITLFRRALEIPPDNYASHWCLGKTHQVLGEHSNALECFEAALTFEQNNADVYREASIEAQDCNDFEKALNYCDQALALRPDDAGLHCNRALAMLLLQRDTETMEAIEASLTLAPKDQITLHVKSLANSIIIGTRPRPNTMKDLL
jgi:tetratricopeptide (TPR) repeat protein